MSYTSTPTPNRDFTRELKQMRKDSLTGDFPLPIAYLDSHGTRTELGSFLLAFEWRGPAQDPAAHMRRPGTKRGAAAVTRLNYELIARMEAYLDAYFQKHGHYPDPETPWATFRDLFTPAQLRLLGLSWDQHPYPRYDVVPQIAYPVKEA